MKVSRSAVLGLLFGSLSLSLLGPLCALMFLATSASTQAWAQDRPAEAAADPGQAMVAGRCFQCHNDSMFRDQRQDSRAWEATIYRMVGRGGIWSTDEIKQMASYLGTALGPDVKPVSAPSR
jgi:mono/diheme cytochrome c family protein